MSSELLEQFLEEGRELIESASGSLLSLEQSPEDEDLVNQIFRSVHTLKGNAGLFDYPALIEILHSAEELMVAVRESSVKLNAEMVDALLAASDVVKNFLDEIEADESLNPDSEQEGRRIAETMAGFLGKSVEGQGAEPGEAEAEVELPAWSAGLPSDMLAPTSEGRVVLVEYRPEKSCFFRGEDPVQIMAAAPGWRWRSLELDREANASDPFECRVVLKGISEAPTEELRHALRYVEEDVQLWVGPKERPQENEAAPLPVGPRSSVAVLAHTIIEKQAQVLSAWEKPSAPSVMETLRRAVSNLGEDDLLAELLAVGPEAEVSKLKAFVAGWEARRRETPRASAAAASSEGGAKEAEVKESIASKVLRVDQAKVDRLMNLIGQMVVAKNALPYIVRKMGSEQDPKATARELKEHSAVVDRITRELQSAIMEVRMLPVSQVFQRFPRLVRDVSRKLDKQIELSMSGEDTQADKNMIEALSEPLVHLVRNSLDHGIESTMERQTKGKPAVGQIRLTAHNENESVVITVEDDGRGVDADMVKVKAISKGVISAEDAERLSDEDARMLIFAPGFSTKEAATELSGRGVGMDVVKTTIERVGGRLSLDSELGEGTQVTLTLPLSMAVSHVMTVTVDGQLYGVGMDSVVETVRYPSDQIRSIKGREALVLRDQLMPVLRLRQLLALPNERKLNGYGEEAVLVLRHGGENIALVVDELRENIEVLVRPLEGWMSQMNSYSGSAVLGDGQLLLVLDMRELIRNGG